MLRDSLTLRILYVFKEYPQRPVIIWQAHWQQCEQNLDIGKSAGQLVWKKTNWEELNKVQMRKYYLTFINVISLASLNKDQGLRLNTHFKNTPIYKSWYDHKLKRNLITFEPTSFWLLKLIKFGNQNSWCAKPYFLKFEKDIEIPGRCTDYMIMYTSFF